MGKQTVPLYLDGRQIGTCDVERNERGEVLGSHMLFFDPADAAEFYRRSREGNRHISVGFVGAQSPLAEVAQPRRPAPKNERKAERRARRGKARKPRGTRQRVAGLCRRLEREEGTT